MNSTLVALFEAHTTKPFCGFLFMQTCVWVYVYFVEAHISPLVCVLHTSSGTHISAHISPLIFFVCVGKVSPFSIVLVQAPGTTS